MAVTTNSLITGIIAESSTPTFTNLTLSSGAAAQILTLNSDAGQVRDIRFQSAGVNRWFLRCDNTAESGSDVGSDIRIIRRTDAGADNGVALFIKRSTGYVSIGNNATPMQQLDVIGGIAANGTIATGSGSSAVVVGKANAVPTNEVPAHVLWLDSGTGHSAGSLGLVARSSAGASIVAYTGTTTPLARLIIDSNGNIDLHGGQAELATNVTDGFVYIPTCNGTPSGTPTSKTGALPMIFDRSGNKLWIYDGAWISTTLS